MMMMMKWREYEYEVMQDKKICDWVSIIAAYHNDINAFSKEDVEAYNFVVISVILKILCENVNLIKIISV